MSLLTPTESHAFQSFLSSMDYSDSFVAPEWNMYSDINETAIPHTVGKESLAKATKDLMSLDTNKWGNPPRPILQSPFQESSPFQNPQALSHSHHIFSYGKSQHAHHLQQQNQSTSFHAQSNARPRVQSQSISIAPLHTLAAPSPPHPDDIPSASSSPASVPTSGSPRTPFEPYAPPPPPTISAAAAGKRPSQDNSRSSSNKRARPSHTPSSSQLSSTPTHKPPLLSPSQKKANHIQSEQKRRANIRRGYEALCETIPSLREAIRLEEEEACNNAGINGASGSGRSPSGSKGKKKTRGRFAEDGEKIDGRAGPRSENIVLQKSQCLFFFRLVVS